MVYDELEADHAAKWSWLLHSPGKMELQPDEQGFRRLTSDNGLFTGQVWIRGSTPTVTNLTTKFFSPAINWLKAKAYDGSVRDYPDQWHFTLDSEPAAAMRYLAVIQVVKDGSAALPVIWKDGVAKIGEYEIKAELATDRPAVLNVNREGAGVFSLTSDQIQEVQIFPSR